MNTEYKNLSRKIEALRSVLDYSEGKEKKVIELRVARLERERDKIINDNNGVIV